MTTLSSPTGIEGLDFVIGNTPFPPIQAGNGYRLLVRGLPGTGKTTLGIALLNGFLNRADETWGNNPPRKGLVVYYQEKADQLDNIAAKFDFEFSPGSVDTYEIAENEFSEGFPVITKWLDNKEEEQKLCILIDGLSILKAAQQENIHKYLLDLMANVPRKNLLMVVTVEEDVAGDDHFFEYMADGVINLSISTGAQRHRSLEITKLRYIDYLRGAHGFELYQSVGSENATLRVHPRPVCHYVRLLRTASDLPEGRIEPGICGLGEVIGGEVRTSGSLQAGDVFVVTAEPGTDKLSMGLSFLSPPAGGNESKERASICRALWVSFGYNSIRKVLLSDPYGSRFEDIRTHIKPETENRKSKRKQYRFREVIRHSSEEHPDSVTSELMRQLSAQSDIPARVVIDGLDDIGRELGDASKTLEYIIWMTRILKKCNAVSLIFVDLQHCFQPLAHIPMEWHNEPDFIGHLRWFEINNQLTMTFVVSKSRYPKFRSVPQYMGEVTEGQEKGRVYLEDRGWPMVSMLSGTMDTIHEAKVFMKFFDQNYSVRSIHEPVLKEFRGRYSEDQNFTHVFRRDPSPTHWSFRGYAGAGHSNTKVVCLKKYIMDILDKGQVLVQIPEDERARYALQMRDEHPTEEYRKARSYSLWGLAVRREVRPPRGRSDPPFGGYAIPLYGDIGILCSQIDEEKLWGKAFKETPEQRLRRVTYERETGPIPRESPQSWDALFQMNARFQHFLTKGREEDVFYHPPWIQHLFTLPSLSYDTSGFMAFFLEILVDFAGEPVEELYKTLGSAEGFRGLIDSEAFTETIRLLRRMVLEGVSGTPLENLHYHTAYFSRRWFSRVDQYPLDDPRLPVLEKYIEGAPPASRVVEEDWRKDRGGQDRSSDLLKERFNFSIHPLPTSRGELGKSGFSCLDIYAIGIIRGALAPETAWMFISELESNKTAINRFEQRRGLPILREHWSAPRENVQRCKDREVLDEILDKDRYFCNFWVPNYWHIESRLHGTLRKIFLNIPRERDVRGSTEGKVDDITPSVEEIKKDFMEVIREVEKEQGVMSSKVGAR